MKILLTGSEGFIGSYVYDMLRDLGHEVVGVDSLEPLVHGDGRVPLRTDLVIPYHSITVADLADVNVLIHLAAQVSVADSMIDPDRYLYHNTRQTYELMTTLRSMLPNLMPERVVVASSSSVYGNVPLPFVEDGPTDPTNVYGLTKLDQEKLTLLWCDMLGIDAIALRLFNVYGPGQAMHNPYTGVMANFARMLMSGESPQLTEDGQQVRDFIYVEDVAKAICLAAFGQTQHRIYNICTGVPTRLDHATIALAEALGSDSRPEVTGSYRPGDQRHVLGTNRRFRNEFPIWKPRSLESGLKDYAAALR
jgi:dTDP-L-rhamnose 4-epimerase